MASVKNIIEAGNEYSTQVAKSNQIITTKKQTIWFKEIADKLEIDMAVSELTLDYNLALLEGEDPMSEAEMAEIMEEKVGNGTNDRECCDCIHYVSEVDEKHILCGEHADARFEVLPEIVHKCSAKTCQHYRLKMEKKYTDWDIMLKDDEIAHLKQRIDVLERCIKHDQGHGVSWKALREASELNREASCMTIREYYLAKRGEL